LISIKPKRELIVNESLNWFIHFRSSTYSLICIVHSRKDNNETSIQYANNDVNVELKRNTIDYRTQTGCHHHHHQPINVPTAGAQAFLLDYT
jgi:hypothetical protein